jgi:hypothetical protein
MNNQEQSFAGGNTESSQISHIDLNFQNLESRVSDRSGMQQLSRISMSNTGGTRNNTIENDAMRNLRSDPNGIQAPNVTAHNREEMSFDENSVGGGQMPF